MLVVTDMMAQDIYTSGYFTNSYGTHSAVVYKNDLKIHGMQASDYCHTETKSVMVLKDTVYWVVNCMDTANNQYRYADIFKGSTRWLSQSGGSHSHINALFHSQSNIFAAGCKTINGVKTAVLWRNNNVTPLRTWGDTIHASEANCATMEANDGVSGGVVIAGGYQYDDSTYHGVIWRSHNVLYTFPNHTSIFGIAYHNGSIYSVGYSYENGKYIVKVWKDNNELYTLTSTSTNGRGWDISVDAGDIYVCGWEGSALKVWKNGSVLHSHSAGGSNLRSVIANTDGVYYAGYINSVGKIWKDGQVLYTPSSMEYIYDMYIDEPTCTNLTTRSLPFFEGFENGATEWACWAKIDDDHYSTASQPSYWDRRGTRTTRSEIGIPSGSHLACHSYHKDSTQEGWLVSPKLAIKNTSNSVTLTFKTYEGDPSDYRYEGVEVSTNGVVYDQVWTQTRPTSAWKTVTVDLSAYKGQNIYIAFRYQGKNGHTWYIDDVSVTEKNTTGIEDAETTNTQISVYPNPVKNMLYVSGITDNTPMVEIFDMTGRKVKQQPATESMSIDIADLAKGVYVLSAGYNKIKFVKE